MNKSEFTEWLEYHMRAYPALRAWLGKAEHVGQNDFWYRRLRDVSLSSARQATDEMHARDEQPKGYADHPRVVYRIAVESPSIIRDRPKVIDGVPVYRCGRCEDSGFVSVLTPKTLKGLWADRREAGLRWCAIACDCDKGTQRMRQPQKRPLPQWATGHVLGFKELESFIGKGDDEWDVARAWLLDYHERTSVRVSTTDDVELSGGYQG